MVTWDNTVLQETVGGEAVADSNMSFLQETQLDLLSRMICVLTVVLDCFSCNFILFFNTYYFSIAPIVREAYVTLIRFISIEQKEKKMSYIMVWGREHLCLRDRKRSKQCAISTCE